MYICICHGISDSTIRKAIDGGARHYRDIAHSLGAGDCCGMCVREVKEMISEQRRERLCAQPVRFQPA